MATKCTESLGWSGVLEYCGMDGKFNGGREYLRQEKYFYYVSDWIYIVLKLCVHYMIPCPQLLVVYAVMSVLYTTCPQQHIFHKSHNNYQEHLHRTVQV